MRLSGVPAFRVDICAPTSHANGTKRNEIKVQKHTQTRHTYSLSTIFINTGIITVRFVTIAVTKVNKMKRINLTKKEYLSSAIEAD